MKKTLAILITLFLISGLGFAATVDTGDLIIYGEIGLGDVTFAVNQTQLSTNRVDLLSAIVQSSGTGYIIGNWEFDSVSQSSAIDYTVTYSYGDLSNGTASIDYVVLEYAEGQSTGGTEKASGGATTINADAGTSDEVRNIGFRLTTTGDTQAAAAPASINYTDTITITLATI